MSISTAAASPGEKSPNPICGRRKKRQPHPAAPVAALVKHFGRRHGKGNLRCDANVSIREKAAVCWNTKTEIKNVNSIDAVKDAIQKEIERQIREVEKGHAIKPWTLDWDDNAGVLRMMRSKETEADYRYFHEPDLLPLEISAEWQVDILEGLPELPLERRARFMRDLQIPEYDADILTADHDLADYFERTIGLYKGDVKISNWLMNDVAHAQRMGMSMSDELTPAYLRSWCIADEGKINITTAKNLLLKIQESGKTREHWWKSWGWQWERRCCHSCDLCKGRGPKPGGSEIVPRREGNLIGWFVGR